MDKLKPCPFCGNTNVKFMEYKAGYGTIGCDNCMFEGPMSDYMLLTKKEAIEWWNRRAKENDR